MIAAAIANQINAINAWVLSSPSSSVPLPSVPIPNTLKGIDELIRGGFETYRASCFNWLLAATGLVVAGLVFEGPELWHDITSIVFHWRFKRRFLFSLPEEPVPNWAKLLAAVGWLLIVVGVAGEYIADSFVSRADGFVQQFDEILLADTTRQAGGAVASAKTAHDEADSVKGIADASRTDAQDALTKAQAAQRELAHAEADAAKAETISSNALGKATESESHLRDAMKLANEATAELKRVTSPRTLNRTPDTLRKLREFENTEYVFSSVFADRESLSLLVQIDDLLTAAGWKKQKPTTFQLGLPILKPRNDDPQFFVPEGIEVGVIVTVDAGPHVQAAKVLNDELIDITLPTPRSSDKEPIRRPTGSSAVVRIDVGKKP